MDESISAAVASSKGKRPSRASWMVIPAANTSLRGSTAPPESCSGDMYCGVPASGAVET
jgi:hypothetical protein